MTDTTASERIAIIGNAGGGKSTLARYIASVHDLPCIEVDRFLWREGWRAAPADVYEAAHADALTKPGWVMDGLGRLESIQPRLRRATRIVLIDMPLWVHFWLAAERQIAWTKASIDHPPAGAAAPPPTEALFRTIWEIEQGWMPTIREYVNQEAAGGKPVLRIKSFDQLQHHAEAGASR